RQTISVRGGSVERVIGWAASNHWLFKSLKEIARVSVLVRGKHADIRPELVVKLLVLEQTRECPESHRRFRLILRERGIDIGEFGLQLSRLISVQIVRTHLNGLHQLLLPLAEH